MQYPMEHELRWAHARILVVDDDLSNARLLSRLLQQSGYCDVHTVTDGRQALEAYRRLSPALVLLDLHMPHVDGFTLLGQIRSATSADAITPVLVLSGDSTAESRHRAHRLGATDYVAKPFELEEVRLRVDALLELRAHAQAGFGALRHVRDAVQGSLGGRPVPELQVLQRLTLACSFRDSMSEGHTRRVGELSGRLAERLELSAETVEALRVCAPLHDVGKIAIPDEVLLKPCALSPDEMSLAERHTILGAVMLSGSDCELLRLAAEIALTHHERWDGRGYPQGLAGEQIPLAGRIVAVADVLDALTNERPYKQAWSLEVALHEMRAGAGTQFDPAVVTALLAVIADGGVIDSAVLAA